MTGAFEMAMLSGVSAFTYDSVMAKYCGDKSSSSIVIGAGDCIVAQDRQINWLAELNFAQWVASALVRTRGSTRIN